jgi:hypothetical protein
MDAIRTRMLTSSGSCTSEMRHGAPPPPSSSSSPFPPSLLIPLPRLGPVGLAIVTRRERREVLALDVRRR